MSIRDAFAAQFGEEEATRIEEASISHMNDPYSIHKEDRWGTDPFRYHLLKCISHECFTKPRFATTHGFVTPGDDLNAWVIEHGGLHLHDGDVPDYLSLMVGVYEPYFVNGERPGWAVPNNSALAEEMVQIARAAYARLSNDHGGSKRGTATDKDS